MYFRSPKWAVYHQKRLKRKSLHESCVKFKGASSGMLVAFWKLLCILPLFSLTLFFLNQFLASLEMQQCFSIFNGYWWFLSLKENGLLWIINHNSIQEEKVLEHLWQFCFHPISSQNTNKSHNTSDPDLSRFAVERWAKEVMNNTSVSKGRFTHYNYPTQSNLPFVFQLPLERLSKHSCNLLFKYGSAKLLVEKNTKIKIITAGHQITQSWTP